MQPNKNGNQRITPFLVAANPEADESLVVTDKETAFDEEADISSWDEYESPFHHATELEGMTAASSAKADEFVSFVAELRDPEFDEEIYELVHELARMYEQQMLNESLTANGARTHERMLELQVEPLSQEIENWIDRLAARLDQEDLETLSEQELEAIFEEYDIDEEAYAPQMEDFFKRLKRLGRRIKNKVKKTVKRAVRKVKKAAKKVGRAAKKIAGRVWNKLKRVAKSLLKRVIKVAINRLPEALQPVARKLAKRFIKEVEEEIYMFKGVPQPGSSNITQIQKEFDVQLAHLVLTEDEAEQERAVTEYELIAEKMTEDPQANLDRARMHFVQRINELEEGEDATPAVEEFIPAVLAGLKLGIRIVGRRRVVNFLAKYIAKLIRRWVGKKWATPLARAIVDLGLRLARLETVEEETTLAGEAVAATVEETIRRVAELDDYLLDNEDLLEAFVVEAFEAAASSNLPPVLSEQVYRKRPQLRQSSRLRGVWVLHPRRGHRRRYKKFTRVIKREITPHMAEMVRTWRGRPLATYFKRRYGIYGRPVQVRIHAYEAIPGTALALIGEYEPDVQGVELATAESFHPLTEEAAGVLLDEPGLGREVGAEFLAEPYHTTIGQRFYYLEVLDEPEMMEMFTAQNGTKRCCETHLVLDFVRRQVRVSIFIDEEDAQELAQKIQRGIRPSILVSNLRATYARGIQRAFSTGADHQTTIIHGAVMPMQLTSDLLIWIPPAFLSEFQRKLTEAVDQGILAEIPKANSRFVAAAQSPSLGMTLVFYLNNPPGLSTLGQLFAGEATQLRQLWQDVASPEITVEIKAGYWHG